jgi:hypothetical protein
MYNFFWVGAYIWGVGAYALFLAYFHGILKIFMESLFLAYFHGIFGISSWSGLPERDLDVDWRTTVER